MLTVSIQAGGKSSRMGQNKALMPFLGRPLIERIVARVTPLAAEVLITTNQPEALRYLGLPLYADLYPERGALGGLQTALACASQPLVAVVACDMPFVNAELLDFQSEVLRHEKADLVIPNSLNGLEPLHGLYRRETCLPVCEGALLAGEWKLTAWFSRVNLRTLQPEELQPYDPVGLTFWNLNTPEEFARAEAIAAQQL